MAKSIRCSCGRIAEVLDDNGKPVCWEVTCESEIAWKARYPNDQEPRHKDLK